MIHPASNQVPEVSAFGVFGVSAAMQPVLRQIREAASNGKSMMICGEAGTGRSRIARSIHALAGGALATFLATDCASRPAGDLETDLFGPEEASRAGKAMRRCSEWLSSDSLLWRAQRGTLYLANIVEMPSPLQVRLARLVRDREASAPDGSRVRLDCRLIASVEPDFDAALAEGRFRRELYSRLAPLSINVPPLRERREDIPGLAEFFLAECAQAAGSQVRTLTPAAAMLLQALPWQGNAFELRGLMESLAQWGRGKTVDLAEVLAGVRLDPHTRSVAVGGTLRSARQRFEREYIGAVLQHSGGSVPAAARTLGIQRTNLYRKMRALGLAPVARSHFHPVNHHGDPGTVHTREVRQWKRS